MQWFSGHGMMPSSLTAQAPVYDHIMSYLVHFFIEGKFYSIFSFLFGFGFALQIARAEERGDPLKILEYLSERIIIIGRVTIEIGVTCLLIIQTKGGF